MKESVVIRFDPPLPCGVLGRSGLYCGNPATVASADPEFDGTYTFMPICQSCAEATARVYGVLEKKQ